MRVFFKTTIYLFRQMILKYETSCMTAFKVILMRGISFNDLLEVSLADHPEAALEVRNKLIHDDRPVDKTVRFLRVINNFL